MDKKASQVNVEFEGINVDDAIQKALKYFGVPKDDLVIRIVSEEKRGLFGMEGAKPAKIIVNLKKKSK